MNPDDIGKQVEADLKRMTPTDWFLSQTPCAPNCEGCGREHASAGSNHAKDCPKVPRWGAGGWFLEFGQ